ncbi:hypothetical protein EG329_009117 [Mollisiaceae sp. DMI_Dod_QoI]|nr:hypothetical protein EG329_009117 [Helotiales sp. DMI_Dod_QoI]
MAESTHPMRTRSSSRKPSFDKKLRKMTLRFSKEQVESFKRSSAIKAESRPSTALPSLGMAHTGRKIRKTAIKPARPISRLVLKMWNGSKVAMYPALTLAIRYRGKVYKHKIKAGRCIQIA